MTDSAVHKIKKDGENLGISPLYLRAKCILAGFSGGADSSLLLSYFIRIREMQPDFPPVMAVHVNHMLRGAESDRDEDFCRKRCEELGVLLVIRRVDVPALMKECGLGAEECARNARYRIFDEITTQLEQGMIPDGVKGDISEIKAAILKEGSVLCATAHNADDNLETVLFNLTRGGGASGLSGIPPVRGDGIIRPLLGLGSEEIRELCRECGIPYVTDSTNADKAYTRNYIRQTVVPLLKNVNPSAADAVIRCGISLREDEAFFRDAAKDAVGEYLPKEEGYSDSIEIPREVLASLPLPVMSRAIVMLTAKVTPIAMGAEHIRLARRLVTDFGTGKLSLPDGVIFEVSKNIVSVSRYGREPEEFCIPLEMPVTDGECLKYACPEAGFDLYLSRRKSDLCPVFQNIYKLSINTTVRFDTIYGKMYARNRLPGDTLFLGGHRRKLKKMLCDKGIPEGRRQRLPVICDDDGIVLVPGLPVRGPSFVRAEDISSDNVLHVLYCLYWRI